MKKTVAIAAFCIHEDECWFFAKEFNCLFYKNIDTEETVICGSVPWEAVKKNMLYKEMEYVNNKLYLIPFKARSIAVYDIAQKTFYKIELDTQIIPPNAKNYFRAGFVYNQLIYAFGVHVPTILVIDTVNDKIEYLTKWFKEVERFLPNTSQALFRKQIVVIEKKAYIPMVHANVILSVDLVTNEVCVKRLNFKVSGYVGVTNDRENIYLAAREGQGLIGCWNCISEQERVIGFLNQDGDEINKYLTYGLAGVEVYYLEHKNSKLSNQFIRNVEFDCDCLLSNGFENAFFCDDGKVELISNGIKKRLDISIEVSNGDKEKIYQLQDYCRESKWNGIENFMEEIIEK